MRVKKKTRQSPRSDAAGRRASHSSPPRLTARIPAKNGTLKAEVEAAAWLAEEVLIAIASFDAEDRPLLAPAGPAVTGAPAALDAGWLSLDSPAAGRKLVLARIPGATAGGSPRFRANTPRRIDFDLAEKVTSLKTLLRTTLGAMDPTMRAAACAFAASATTFRLLAAAERDLGRSLSQMRDALRERLPYCEIAADKPFGLHIDWLGSVDPQSFYVRGWLHHSELPVTSLVAVSPEGHRVELLPSLHRYGRADIHEMYPLDADEGQVEKSGDGFVGFFQTSSPSRLCQGWMFEATEAAGMSVEVSAPAVARDPLAVRDSILGNLVLESHPRQQVVRRHLFPALTRLQERFNAAAAVESVEQYGQAPQSPAVSVVVPLYRRIDFVEQQLAQFADDPQVLGADLIYVLDSPELADQLRGLAPRLHGIYQVPFRVAVMNQNAGYSAANNVGVSLARAPLLVLMNSDVLPDRPGWLGALEAFYRATPGIGALGPKLLYEDDSLQHAGMYFVRDPESLEWGNWHYFKGMHRHLPAANVARAVPAVTGACLMIETELYRQIGGLRGMFVQGDFEDSDLCLRLAELGRQNWYLPAVELYHLEGQSYPSKIRQMASRYNCWLQTELWREQIEGISQAAEKETPTHPSQEFAVTAQLTTHYRPAPSSSAVQLKDLFDADIPGISTEISPHDLMYNTSSAEYFELGQKAVQIIKLAMLAAGKARADRILDLPCGHGRVLRALRAAFPAAEITACDLDRDGVDFCAQTFGAVPVYSHTDPAAIPLTGGFDLIWCGSLLTHLGARRWPEFLRRFHSLLSPGGLLVFTTSGPWVARYLREGSLGLSPEGNRQLLADYDVNGFGYHDYEGQPGYGISVASPAWVCSQLSAVPGLQLLNYTERGWNGFQDSVACVRAQVPAGRGAAQGAAESDWDQLRNAMRESVARHVPHGAAVAVVSGGDEELLKCGGNHARHFPQDEEGAHAGHNPTDSTEAAFHLAELCAKGAGYLLVPKPSLWWLEHYREFAEHLESRHRLLDRQDSHALYALAFGVGLDASSQMSRGDAEASELPDPLPPEELRFVGPGDFVKIGRDFLKIFLELGGLQPDHQVLDVGSGVGRMALPLTKYLKAPGGYAGIEIVPAGVKWCVDNITSRHPNFRFHHSDIFNAHYNPEGRVKAADYRFPFDDGSFDFIFLTSVFTHMLPDDIRHYFSEISRVLRPGGRCLITYFLLNQESLGLMQAGKSTIGVPFERGIYRIADEAVPEAVTAYDESFVLDLYRQFGLIPKHPLDYGNWCGRQDYVSFQDIIVASKPHG